MIPAQGFVKNYHWGKVGNDSYIARFRDIARDQFHSEGTADNPDEETSKPLAEIWFGVHPLGPATVRVGKQNVKLDSLLSRQPEMVGSIEHYRKFSKKLPFLMKILSISEPLSLQAHPDKKLAQDLHQKDPKNYPDSNHKPELAIALTEFEVLCDFRPSSEIVHYMRTILPFRRLVGQENYDCYANSINNNEPQSNQRLALSNCFKSLMTRHNDAVLKETKKLLLDQEATLVADKDLISLISYLDRLYPGDPGTFMPFFLNYVKLAPGQAIYLKANKLHAYIRGECIECMASSDNVVRAGLTTKYRDIKTLLTMLDYDCIKDVHDLIYKGLENKRNPSILTFAPTEDFKVDKIVITGRHSPETEQTLTHLLSGSFIVVLGGKASVRDFYDPHVEHKLVLGSAGYIPPKIALKIHNVQGTLTIYRCYC